MTPRGEDGLISKIEAQEVYRRMEALATRLGAMAESMAVMTERHKTLTDNIVKLEKETANLLRLANRGFGVILALTVIGGAMGTFWDRISKLWGH